MSYILSVYYELKLLYKNLRINIIGIDNLARTQS